MRPELKAFIEQSARTHQELLEQEAREAGVLQAGEQLVFYIELRQLPTVMSETKPIQAVGRHGKMTYLPDNLSIKDFQKILSFAYSKRALTIINIFANAGGQPVPHSTFDEAFGETGFRTNVKFEVLNSAFRQHKLPFRVNDLGVQEGVKYYKIFKIMKSE